MRMPFTPDTSDLSEPIERAVAYLIHDKVREIGLEPELKGESMERPNVVAALRGAQGKNAVVDMARAVEALQGGPGLFAGPAAVRPGGGDHAR